MVKKILSLLIVASFTLTSCDVLTQAMGSGLVPTPELKFKSAEVTGLSLSGLDLVFDMEVENPYSAGLPISDLSYSVASNGNTFLKGETQQLQQTIPANSSKVLELPLSIGFQEVIQLVGGIQSQKSLPYEAEMTLNVNAPGVGLLALPLTHSDTLTVPGL
jgi:LEA14-like dessication related protein